MKRITKITYQCRSNMTITLDQEGVRRPYGEYDPKRAAQEILDGAGYDKLIAAIIEDIANGIPDGHTVESIIKLHMPNLSHVDVAVRTKKYRVYSIPCLWIHEED